MRRTGRAFIIAAIAVGSLLSASGAAGPAASRDVLYQVSTNNALASGVFEGAVSIEKVLQHGDIGIGTLEGLDGELIIVDKNPYRITAAGKVLHVEHSVRTPFAQVTLFDAERVITLYNISDLQQFEQLITNALPLKNIPFAFRIHGRFSYVKTRSVAKQSKPYPPLIEVTKSQSIFERRDVAGTIVGFRVPHYFQGMSPAGYHFHFVSDDRRFGGHLLSIAARKLEVAVDETAEVHFMLPGNDAFQNANLSTDRSAEIIEAEQ